MDDQIAAMLRALGGISPRFDETISYAFHHAVPGDITTMFQDGEDDENTTLWLVLEDIGLARCTIWKDSAGKAHAAVDICPWRDVVNPELTVEAIQMETGGEPAVQVKFLIQIPRMDVTTTSTVRSAELSAFAGEVLRRTK